LVTAVGGLASTGALVGFGFAQSSVDIGTIIFIPNVGITIGQFALSMPGPGAREVTAIYGTFDLVASALLVGSTVTITATLYEAAPGTSSFMSTGVSASTDPIAGPITVGNSYAMTPNGITYSAPLGQRLTLVVSATGVGTFPIAFATTGFISAGVAIS
jgi:hypothetical protein